MLFVEALESQSGNKELFIELYEKYNALVYSVAYEKLKNNALCEDCVQDTYLTVMLKINHFENLSENHRKNLICTIARGKAIDCIRKENPFHDTENIENVDISYFDSFDSVVLARLIESLPEFWQTFIFLKYTYGFSNVEISKMYNISASYVGRIIKSALNRLKNELEGKCNE